jgi:broad specificity phosphatase PhoE
MLTLSGNTTVGVLMQTRVLFVRHADVHNPRNVFYGRLPRFGLSKIGWEQAQRTADYLAVEAISAIYTSPQLRARQTGRVIGRRHPEAPLKVTRRIAEVYSSVQGLTFAEIGPNVNIYEPPRSPADETIRAVFDRMHKCLVEVAARHAGQTVVCVSHADPIMFLRVGVEGKPLVLASMRGPDYPDKGSITEFVFERPGDRPRSRYVDASRLAAVVVS